MTEADRIKYLRIALVVVGLIFIFGIGALTILWPSGWAWHAAGRSEYLEMILGIYATLGVIMAAQSVANPQHIGHLWGDVLALIAVAAVLPLLTPRQTAATQSRAAA